MKQKQEDGFLGTSVVSMASSLVQSVTSSLINAISGKGVIRARKRHKRPKTDDWKTTHLPKQISYCSNRRISKWLESQ